MSKLPDGFVYLDEINSNIISNLLYFTNINVTGAPIKGYKANRAILTRQAALALDEAWKEFDSNGFNVVIYDAYRPQKAVNHIIEWSSNETADQSMKAYFYPYINHSDIFNLAYFARKSGHTRGSTIDMTIIAKEAVKLKEIKPIQRTLADGRIITYLDDGTVDMGSSFDLLDLASSGNSELVPPDARLNRSKFIEIMDKAGFNNNKREWWHFSLRNEPYPDTYFDFDVE